jgi:isopentenyl diphosphate isomerase/L-lactate dehydrogenase-like FMN-dependent dehydrogenase
MTYLPEMTRKITERYQHNKSELDSSLTVCNNVNAFTSDSKHGMNDQYEKFCFNVNDFQLLARKLLPKDLYEYLASGSDDAQTLAENRAAFQRWFLRPRVMRPVGRISTRTELFGHAVSMPVFVSPAGVHALCDSENGECATARACAKAGILCGISQHSTRSIEEVAAAVPSLSSFKFYQAYILKDRTKTLSLVDRAVRAGYQGIFLTVDSVRFGYREPDARNGFNVSSETFSLTYLIYALPFLSLTYLVFTYLGFASSASSCQLR